VPALKVTLHSSRHGEATTTERTQLGTDFGPEEEHPGLDVYVHKRADVQHAALAAPRQQAVSAAHARKNSGAWRASPGRTVLLRCFSWLYASMTPSKRSSYLGPCAKKGGGMSKQLPCDTAAAVRRAHTA
jgi:hypothetical protein